MTSGLSHFVDAAGVRLHAVELGPANARPPALLLHGFTGSAESMAGVAKPLAADRRVLRLELVGHGRSAAPEDVACYAMEACVSQTIEVMERLGIHRPHLIGYSMGGRTALSAATAHPEHFASVTLVGATAGIADETLRAERVAADRALADRIEAEGLEAFVDHWMALPLFASQARLGSAFLERARAERMAQRPRGLAHSLRGMGAGAQPPVFDRLERCVAPVLLAVGGLDEKFRAIAERLAAGLPDARIAVLEDVGHAAHLEAPEAFVARLRDFLAEVEAGAARGVAQGDLDRGRPKGMSHE